MTDNSALSHNMSAPPRSVVRYEGLGFSFQQEGRTKRADHVSNPSPKLFGMAVRFVLPVALSREEPAGLLEHLGINSSGNPEQKLSELIDRRAEELPLPDGCVVIPVEPHHQPIWSDTLSALAVLAKCSAAVWLRAKTPSVRSALDRQRVSLLVPPEFAAKLPKEEQ